MTGDEYSNLPAPWKVPAARNKMMAHQPVASIFGATSLAAEPLPAGADRMRKKGGGVRAVGLACAWLALAVVPAVTAQEIDRFPQGTIAKIEFEGTTIPPGAGKLKPKLLSRAGQPLSHEKAEADLKSLMGTRVVRRRNLLSRRVAAQEWEIHA